MRPISDLYGPRWPEDQPLRALFCYKSAKFCYFLLLISKKNPNSRKFSASGGILLADSASRRKKSLICKFCYHSASRMGKPQMISHDKKQKVMCASGNNQRIIDHRPRPNDYSSFSNMRHCSVALSISLHCFRHDSVRQLCQ